MHFGLERVQKYIRDLKPCIYRAVNPITSFEVKEGFFKNHEELENSDIKWSEYKTGDYWGGKDIDLWFRFDVEVPDEFSGRPVALYISTGLDNEYTLINPQFLIYINGEIVQGMDINHREVILHNAPSGGEKFHIDLKAHSGMWERKVDLFVQLVSLDQDTRNLYYNIAVPLEVAQNLSEGDDRRTVILTSLNETINILDMRKPHSVEYSESVEKADKYIEENFYKDKCGKEENVASIIGHTHIDLKEDYPELYEKVKEKIIEGRWEAEGGMWVEADCNLSSGESLVRQLLFGTRFFEKEFGVKNKILWLPDVFGYSAVLPQILKKSGIDYFMTTKISWNQFNKIPYDTFNWVGIDGSEVLTHFITTKDLTQELNPHFTTYNGFLYPEAVMGGWDRYQQKDINKDILVAYGYGDGGGGPTKEMLENHRRMEKGIPGCPKTKVDTALGYFERLENTLESSARVPKWVGELYLEYHRGTYTSMARNKRDNRKSEILYLDIESLASMATSVTDYQYPQDVLNQGWEVILRNQFHDILPGSSIKEVYDDSDLEYKYVFKTGTKLLNESLQALSKEIAVEDTSVLAFNTLSFERDDLVRFESDRVVNGVRDENGNIKPCQMIEEDDVRYGLFYGNKLPAKGYKAFEIEKNAVERTSRIIVSASRMENQFFVLELDEKGNFSSIFDKINQRELLKENEFGNKIYAYEDKPMGNDNWDIDMDSENHDL